MRIRNPILLGILATGSALPILAWAISQHPRTAAFPFRFGPPAQDLNALAERVGESVHDGAARLDCPGSGACKASSADERTCASAPGVQSGVSLLVRAHLPSGALLREGTCRVAWSSTGAISSNAPLTEISHPIVAGQARLVLPSAATTARVLLTADGWQPGVETLFGLRAAEWTSAAEREARARTIDVYLESSDAGAVLEGSVLVDGVRRCPAGLGITLRPTLDPSASRATQVHAPFVLVDEESASYRAAPFDGTQPWGLFVVSDETRPQWIPLGVDPRKSDRRLDLELDSGRALRLSARSARGSAPVVDARLQLDISVPVAESSAMSVSDAVHLRRQTDAGGRCEFRGIPERGVIRVRWLTGDADRPAEQLVLEEVLEPGGPRVLERELRLDDREPCRLWGSLAQLPGWRDQGSHRIELRVSDPQHGVWGLNVPLVEARERWWTYVPRGSTAEFWVERDGRRISERSTLSVPDADEYGPLCIPELAGGHLRVHWRDAPIGAQLDLHRMDRGGRLEPECARVLESSEGCGEIPDVADATTRLDLVRGQAWSVGRVWLRAAPGSEDVLDLQASTPCSLALRLDGQVPAGERGLQLQAFERIAGAGALWAKIRLVGGCSDADVPLPPGRYGYRVEGHDRPGAILGILEIPAGAGSKSVSVSWNGETRRLAELRDGAGRALEVVACDGIALDSRLGIGMRVFPLEDWFCELTRRGTPSSEAQVLVPRGAVWRIVDRP